MAIEELNIEELEQQLSSTQLIPEENPYYWHFRDIKDVLTDEDEDSKLHRGFFKNLGKLAAAGVFAGVVSAVPATVITMATPSKGALGPLPSNEITPTRDNALTVKLTADLSLVKPLKGQDGVGAKIVPQEIPDINLTSPESLAAILGGFGDGKEVIKEGENAVWQHWKGVWEASTLAAVGLMSILYYSHGPTRRAELAEKVFSTPSILGALSLCLLLSNMNIDPWNSAAAAEARNTPGDSLFKGTPFEGAYFKGKLGDDARDVLSVAINLWRETNSSYDELMNDYEEMKKIAPLLTARPGTKTTVLAANLKCNTFMNRFMRRIYEDTNADALFITADSITGSIDKLDEFCTNALGSALRDKLTAITDGNHANKNTAKLEIKNGLMVLDGKAVDVSVFRAIGVSDEFNSVYGVPSNPDTQFRINQIQGEELSDAACADGNVAVVAGPNREITDPTLKSGCAKLGLGGDRATGIIWIKTTEDGPGKGGYVPLEIGANSGGVLDGQLTLGELKAPATFVIDQTDETTNELLYRQVITFFPGGGVSFSAIEAPKPPEITPPLVFAN